MNRHIPVILFSVVCLVTEQCSADILLPGHKSISHQLVFESSPLFGDYSLVAAPIRGIDGVHVVVPGQPFPFSSKYGTRFYLVPESDAVVSKFDREQFDHWPSTLPPVSHISSVPVTSPVNSAVTTLRFAELQERRASQLLALVLVADLSSRGRCCVARRSNSTLAFPPCKRRVLQDS